MAIPKDGRVQVADYNPREALQPAPLPSSTYVRPPDPQVDNTFGAIAAALGNFASFASQQGKGDPKKDKEVEDAWAAQWALKSQPERDADLAAGRVPEKYKRVGGIISGQSKANEWGRSLPDALLEYDPAVDGSKADYLQSQRSAAAQGLTEDEAVGFEAGSREYYEKAQDGARQEADNEAGLKKVNEMVGYLRVGVDSMVSKGAKAEDVVRKVFTDANIDPKLSGLPNAQKNAVFLELAKEWAVQGRPDLIQAMLDYDRPEIGPLSDTVEMRDQFLAQKDVATAKDNEENLLKRAPEVQKFIDDADAGEFTVEDMNAAHAKYPTKGQKYFTDLYEKSEGVKGNIAARKGINDANSAAMNTIHQADVQSLIAGTFGTQDKLPQEVPMHRADGTVEMKKVTWAERKDAALLNLRKFTERMRKQGATEPQIQQMEMAIVAKNRLVHPGWEGQMKGVSVEGMRIGAAKGDTTNLQQTGELYRNIYKSDTSLAKTHVTETRDEVWFESYRMSREGGGSGADAAITASIAVDDYNKGVVYKIAAKDGFSPHDRALGALKDHYKGSSVLPSWLGGSPDQTAAISPRATTETIKRAEFYMQAGGMDEREALKAAAKWMSETHVVIGKEMVFAGYEGMPANFKERTDQWLTDKYGDAAKNYSVVDIEGGHTFLVIDPNGMPAMTPGKDKDDQVTPGVFVTYTVDEVLAHGKAKDDEVIRKKIQDKEAEREELGMTEEPPTPVPTAIAASTDERDILIRTVLGEAGSEGASGMEAVAHTIVNRTKDERWADNIKGVALQSNKKGFYQFSAWNSNGKTGNDLVLMKPTDPRYKKAGAIVDRVLSGESSDPTGGAVYYANLNDLPVTPKWWGAATDERGGANMPLGRHTFTGRIRPRKVQAVAEGKAPPKTGQTRPAERDLILNLNPLGGGGYVASVEATHKVDVGALKPTMKKNLVRLTKAWGDERLVLTSANRDPDTNKAVGGKEKGQHPKGTAVDIDVQGWSIAKRTKFLELASSLGFTGIGVYHKRIHLDIGGRRAWGPTTRIGSIPAWARGWLAKHLNNSFGRNF